MAKRTKLEELSPAQLETKINELEGELREFRFKKVVATVDSPADMKKTRKEIARAKTMLNEYRLGIMVFDENANRRIQASEAQ